MPRTSRIGALLAASLGAAACSSGGGGGGATAPTIVTAAFVGAGAAPAAGDLLYLTLSKPVALVAGTTVDDDDFELSTGTLGAAAATAAVISAQTVRLTLGSGVSFTPGATTIAFSDANDAIASTDGAIGRGGQPAMITSGDGDQPAIVELTLDGIDDELNGEGPAGGILQVPPAGFTIDLAFADATSAIDPTRTFLASDKPVSVGGALRQPGQDLADGLSLAASTADSASFFVPATVAFPAGDQVLTAVVTDASGMSSAPVSFAFRVRSFDAAARPFEAGQLWYLDLGRDVESIALDLSITEAPNGNPDIEDVFTAIGLHSPSIPEPATNAMVTAEISSRMLEELAGLFDGAPIQFTFDAPGTFPAGESAVPYQNFGFSQICIAGSADSSNSGVLGSALFNRSNTQQENNCLTDFGASNVRLGVFPHASLLVGFQSGAASTFRLIYDPLTPVRGGTPIGDAPGDAARLAEVAAGTNAGADPRITQMDVAIGSMARLLAVVTAHECGHSMGLVANGAMPAGLYGGDAANFPMTGGLQASAANGHIQNSSLFPAGAQNVMSPAINFDAAQSPATVFNTLNLAYLRERAIHDPN